MTNGKQTHLCGHRPFSTAITLRFGRTAPWIHAKLATAFTIIECAVQIGATGMNSRTVFVFLRTICLDNLSTRKLKYRMSRRWSVTFNELIKFVKNLRCVVCKQRVLSTRTPCRKRRNDRNDTFMAETQRIRCAKPEATPMHRIDGKWWLPSWAIITYYFMHFSFNFIAIWTCQTVSSAHHNAIKLLSVTHALHHHMYFSSSAWPLECELQIISGFLNERNQLKWVQSKIFSVSVEFMDFPLKSVSLSKAKPTI